MNGQFNFGELQPIRYFLVIAIMVGVLFSFIAPDNDADEGWLRTALQWQLQTVIPMFLAIFAHTSLSHLGALVKPGAWSKLVISGSVAALLFSPIAVMLDWAFTGEAIERSILIDSIDELTSIAPPIIICWLAINAPFQFGWRLMKNPVLGEPEISAMQTSNEVANVPHFANLLPDEIAGDVIYLKSELHYLQVVTDKGKALILYSLKNAIAELEAVPGMQPHRSYWVKRDYVQSLSKQGRQGTIELFGGYSVPVSRNRLASVREVLEL